MARKPAAPKASAPASRSTALASRASADRASAPRATEPDVPRKAPATRTAARPANRAAAAPGARRAHRVDGNRSALIGPSASSGFVQAASDHAQIPRVANPTPVSYASANGRLRALARYQRTNDAWIKGLVDRLVERIVDTGPVPLFGDPVLQDLWTQSAPVLDPRGTHGWAGLLSELVTGWLTDAEGFLLNRVPEPDGYDDQGFPLFADGSVVPLKLRTMTPEWVPEWQTGIAGDLPGAGYCIQGVILDRDDPDRRIGYWMYDQFPFTTGNLALKGLMAAQVPAAQVAHLFKPAMAGAYRGENRLTPVLIRSLRLADYEDAEIRRKQLNCALGFFLEQDPATAGEAVLPGEYSAATGGEVGEGEGGTDYESVKSQFEVSPGAVNVMPAGMRVKVHDPSATPQTDDWWTRHQLLAYGACFGLPLHEVAPDITDLSDRSMKFAQTKTKIAIERDRAIVEHQVCRKVARWFVAAAFMSGRWKPAKGRTLDSYMAPSWRWPIIRDALMAQDLTAYLEALKAKAISRDWVTQSFLGLDPAEVARSLVETAARDRLAGFGDTPTIVAPAGSVVIPGWDPATPYALEVLAEVAASEGVPAEVAASVPPPQPPPQPAPQADPADGVTG